MLLVEGRREHDPTASMARVRWGEVAAAAERLPAGTLLGVVGGLTADNVGQVVRRLRPALVDVTSGVEAEPGRKDPALVREFVRAARRVLPGRA